MSCPAILQGYTKSCRDAQGGVKKFYITETANISSYTVSSGVLTALTMVSGKKFWLYEQEINLANYNEVPTPNRSNGTIYYDQNFKAKLHKRSANISYGIKALAQQNVSIIEVEQTGLMCLAGLINGLSLEPSPSDTGTNMGDANGYDLIFKGQEADPAPTVSDAILAAVIV